MIKGLAKLNIDGEEYEIKEACFSNGSLDYTLINDPLERSLWFDPGYEGKCSVQIIVDHRPGDDSASRQAIAYREIMTTLVDACSNDKCTLTAEQADKIRFNTTLLRAMIDELEIKVKG